MFLEVVTRTFRRPKALAACMTSVALQSVSDHRHVVLHDDVGIGVTKANALLATYTPRAEYVWVLDDDDLCVDATLVASLRDVAWVLDPPAFVLKMDHGPELGVLPSWSWEVAPVEGDIGCSAIVTRRDVWMLHRQAWASGRYASDFDFIAAVFDAHGPQIVWLDRVASATQNGRSMGRPE